jgi:hypothetical protein
MTPGSSTDSKVLPVFFLYQSRIRPTNGEIKVTLASAQATACGKPKRRVKLQ